MDPITLLLAVVVLCGIALPVATGVRRSARVRRGEIVLEERTNTLAILGFVLSFFVSVAAIVLCHIALSQINRTNERGWGLAAAGLSIGYLGLLAGAIGALVLLDLIARTGF